MKKLLIQANNLDMVIDTFMYIHHHPTCTKQDIADYNGFTLRQVDYYTNACKYLDLINDDWSMTPLALDIYANNEAQVTERVYARIICDEIMGQIFARMFVFPEEDVFLFAKDLVMEYYPGYSDAVYNRRTKNIMLWCDKIIKKYNH